MPGYFAQIYDSSIAENYQVRHVFMDLLVLADRTGIVDMTVEAIARRTNVPVKVIRKALLTLLTPDPDSRSGEEDGRRLVPLDPEREWGWQIVNFDRYHSIKNEDAKRAYMKVYMRKRRAEKKAKKEVVNPVKVNVNPLTSDVKHVDVDVDVDVLKPPPTAGDKPKKAKPLACEHQALSQYFCEQYEKHTGVKYIVQGGRDGKAAKLLLEAYKPDEVKAMIEAIFNDDWGKANAAIHLIWDKQNKWSQKINSPDNRIGSKAKEFSEQAKQWT